MCLFILKGGKGGAASDSQCGLEIQLFFLNFIQELRFLAGLKK